MTDTIDIEADDEIETLTTLMEAKTGNHVLPAEAIREAVAYWLANHEVAECDGAETTTPSPVIPRPEVSIHDGEVEIERPERPSFDDIPLGTTRGDDGTIPKR